MKHLRLNGRVLITMVATMLLVAIAGPASATSTAGNRTTVAGAEFIGSTEFETGFVFDATEVGGLSGLVYDKHNDLYYALSDDKSSVNDARFYSLTIDVGDGALDDGDIVFSDVTFLTDSAGNRFAAGSLDPEGFELVKKGNLFIGSERDLNNEPWIKRFDLSGQENLTLPLPEYYLPVGDPQTSGVFTNLAFESLTATPNERFMYAATENALAQDGPKSTIDDASPSRVLEYWMKGNRMNDIQATREFVYEVDPIPFQVPGKFADNGLVELQAIDNSGTFLAMERSFASGIGNTVRIFETSIRYATDVSGIADIHDVAYVPMSKELVLDLGDYGVTLDNLEGMALGPRMDDGRYPLFVVSDNNFNPPFQRTLFMAFAIDFDHSR